MRTISKRTQYGLKVVLNLARRYGEGPVLIATLSREESVPLKFLEAHSAQPEEPRTASTARPAKAADIN